MEHEDYPGFFRSCMGVEPFPYQSRLSEAESLPRFVNAPTGTGKTLAALGAWLWRRFGAGGEASNTPRRLVYCLPLRTLAGQTCREARNFIESAGLSKKVPVYLLMGGEKEEEWFLHPESECVVVGTQDMLLSRALNRGYAQSRYAWPRSFGLLNNDCLWVFDEVQLMSSALATSAQLHGLRERFGTIVPCSSMWMSATLDPTWFDVPDFDPEGATVLSIDEEDLGIPEIRKRVEAVKMLSRFGELKGDSKDARLVTAGVIDEHKPGTQTLVVLNTVERARALYDSLARELGKRKGSVKVELVLAHSRFRRRDRDRLEQKIMEEPNAERGRILVSTQVVEAGVNITCATLFTELAPWPSLVQRLGRCNRFGEEEEARAFWLDISEKQYPPYEQLEMEPARKMLRELEGLSASPAALARIGLPTPPPAMHFVLRARDLEGLFDTSPDLAGDDTDVSRFIREGDSLDASVFWRDFEDAAGEDKPRRDELCPVPIGQLRSWLEDKKYRAWTWDYLDGIWREAGWGALHPGSIVMLRASAGGYASTVGWDPRQQEPVEVVEVELDPVELEGTGEDPGSYGSGYRWVTLEEHSSDTLEEVRSIMKALGWDAGNRLVEVLERSAALHDAGKASLVFQSALLSLCEDGPSTESGPWAKAPGHGGRIRYGRDYFRHELAGALALISDGTTDALSGLEGAERDLAVFLVASHHGRVRLAIRPVPGEQGPADGRRFALGVWDGDELPAVRLGGGFSLPSVRVELACMELGSIQGPSWSERVAQLRDSEHFGPFRLGFLEALLRAADSRASIRERGQERGRADA